jgi:hypothetical protein
LAEKPKWKDKQRRNKMEFIEIKNIEEEKNKNLVEETIAIKQESNNDDDFAVFIVR